MAGGLARPGIDPRGAAFGADWFGGAVRWITSPEDPGAAETTDYPVEFGFGSRRPRLDPAPESVEGQPAIGHPWNLATWRGFRTSDPDDPARHIGRGGPLIGTSWLNRPFHVGWFVGGVVGDALIDGAVEQGSDLFGGYRAGWDWDHYWGAEARVGFARPELIDADAIADPRISRNWFGDVHLLHYPWGDAGWRPFFSVGLGWATFRFTDADGDAYHETLLHAPFGVGVKYYVDRWMALRIDALDNLALSGSGLDTMHNLSFTLGLEAHFR